MAWNANGTDVYADGNKAYSFDANNVFNNWDLNPLAQQVGAGADGVRDSLSTARDAFLQPYMSDYRTKVGAGNSADDDQTLFSDSDFQNFVKTGQTSKGYKVDDTPAGAQSTTQQWTQTPNAPQIAPATEDPRRNLLYDTLMKRATADVNPDPNDPTIKAQTDAFGAEQDRARRNAISDAAEQGGPFANLAGVNRMATERAGQQAGAFKAQLLGQELSNKRADTLAALQSAIAMNDTDTAESLQERLANLDAVLKEQGLNLQNKGLDNNMSQALLSNDQFMRQLGLNEWDRANYWDALKTGYLG